MIISTTATKATGIKGETDQQKQITKKKKSKIQNLASLYSLLPQLCDTPCPGDLLAIARSLVLRGGYAIAAHRSTAGEHLTEPFLSNPDGTPPGWGLGLSSILPRKSLLKSRLCVPGTAQEGKRVQKPTLEPHFCHYLHNHFSSPLGRQPLPHSGPKSVAGSQGKFSQKSHSPVTPACLQHLQSTCPVSGVD